MDRRILVGIDQGIEMNNQAKELRNALNQAGIEHGSVRMVIFRECYHHARSCVYNVSEEQRESFLKILPNARMNLSPFDEYDEALFG